MPERLQESSRLWLVRHAQSAAQTEEELSIDSNLSALGRKQAARLQEPLSKIRFDAVFLSPLRRARQTFQAACVSPARECVSRFDSRIVEVMQKGGYLPLLPYESLPDYAEGDSSAAWDDDIRERALSFYAEVEALSLERSDILVVSHAMVLNVLFHVFAFGSAEGDPETYKNCRPGNASISVLQRSPGSKRFDTLRLWNWQDHLAGLPCERSFPGR